MIKIRSASLFRLLCLAIGGLAVALLAMVVLMVRPVVFGGESAGVAAGPVGPATPKKSAPVAVARNLATWHDLVSPPAPEADQNQPAAQTKDAEGGYIFVGSIRGGASSYAILQRQKDRKQLLIGLNDEDSEVRVREVAEDTLVADINGQPVRLRRVDALAPKAAKSPARGAQSGSRPTARRTTTTSSSYSLVSRRAAAAGQPATRSSGQTQRRTVTRNAAGRTTVISRPTATQGASTRTSTNWRQYWQDRLKRRQTNTKK